MPAEESHPTDPELLALSDGELSAAQAAVVGEHLEECWRCRGRLLEIEQAIAGFIRAQRETLDRRLPPAAGPRALLKAHLAAQSAGGAPKLPWGWPMASLAALFVCALLLTVGVRRFHSASAGSPAVFAVPEHRLTPGATVRLTRDEVCSAYQEKNRAVPMSVRRQVLAAYGISTTQPDAYEIDYLITPALGGSDDIRNLWPQAYSHTVWNANVKDELEDRLRDLVCTGNLDLSTAQREIATDWIAAYKKYFHTDDPRHSGR